MEMCGYVPRRACVRAAFRAKAERSATGRAAAAAPPFLPPFFEGALLIGLPTPEPLFLPRRSWR